MSYPTAYLLIFHGSSDPRPQLAATALANQLAENMQLAARPSPRLPAPQAGFPAVATSQARHQTVLTVPAVQPLERPLPLCSPMVGTASLECSQFPLHIQIQQFCHSLRSPAKPVPTGGNPAQAEPQVVILLPLFLLPGVHVMVDLPAEVAQAQAQLGSSVHLMIAPYLGSHPGMLQILSQQIAELSVDAWILLTHGSRRPGANQTIQTLAKQVGAIPAFWTNEPSLETRCEELLQLGCRTIAVLPYFLFPGGTTDAIAHQVKALADSYPNLRLHLTPPLAVGPDLTHLLLELAMT